jgi:erythritol transport system permease protein
MTKPTQIPSPAETPAATPSARGPWWWVFQLMRFRTVFALMVVLVFFAFAAPSFLSLANFALMSKHIAINAFLAIGLTFVIVAGGIDLSVGSIVGFIGIVVGVLLLNGLALPNGYTIWFSTLEIMVIALGLGAAIGAINGLVVTRLHVAPFIATLGSLYVVRGAAMLMSGGRTFPNLTGDVAHGTSGFPLIGAGSWLGLALSVWLLVLVALGAGYLARRTPLGRHIYAVGGNAVAARLSGIRVGRVTGFTYVFSGMCAAIVGLIVTSELQAAHPAAGETFELNAIAAAVLGGTSMSGGRGAILGTVIGAVVIGVLSDGMVMMGLSAFWQMVIKGLVIVAAVVLDQAQERLKNAAVLREAARAV